MMPTFSFPPCFRLRKKNEFNRVFQAANKYQSGPLYCLCRLNTLGHPRLGVMLAKRHIRHANTRNRIRRCFKEVFRLNKISLPAVDIIVLAHKGAAELSKADAAAHALALWGKITSKEKVTPNR